MRRVNRIGLIAVLAVAAAALPALAGNVTVGRFYTEIAKAKQLTAVDGPSAEASLRAAGFQLPNLALGKTLTEGDVTSISGALGLKVTTTRPSEPVSDSQVTQFVSSFGTQLGKGGASTPGIESLGGDPGNSGNGKGKKKGHNKSSSEPL